MYSDDLDEDVAWGGHHDRARDRKHQQRKKKPRFPEPAHDPPLPTRGALVLESTRDHALLRVDGEVRDGIVPPAIRQEGLAPGDEVVVALGEPAVVRRRLPRRTSLSRRHPHQPHHAKVIVANVDWIAIVGAATDPPFRPGLVDRYLLAVHHGGARPIVVITKADTAAERAHADALLAPWAGNGIDCVACSARTGHGLDALLAAFDGGRGAFVGHSGVGKSSLLAALGVDAAVGALADHGRGRHTTTSAHLHVLAGGAEVIDTPGVRAFGPWESTRADLHAAFPDVAALAAGCGFTSCHHAGEADCAVLDAVDDGRLDADRLARFLRLAAVELR